MIKTSEFTLLYLHDYIDKQLSGECSSLFSRPGMQENLSLSKSSLSENISSLTKGGLIEERRKYVSETGRYRNFYFLTQEGIVKAKELQEEVGKRKVKVREKDELREMKISELTEYLKKIAKKPIEKGYSYLVKGEKTDKAYEVFKDLRARGYDGIVISDVSPKKVEKNYKIKEEIYWLSEITGENVLKPDRLDFEITATISNFLKENEKPVIMLEGFEYLSQINGFDTCLKWMKIVTDIIAKNDGILILPINPVVFSEKEFSLLSQNLEIYEPRKRAPVEINYTNILKNITLEGFLDIRTILEPKRYVDYSNRKPELKYFVGREKELKEIKDFLKSSSKILCLKGIAGIGKTAILSKFVEGIEMNVFWHRFTEFTTLRSLLIKTSDFLSRLERRKLENYLKGEKFEVEEILILLEQELKGSNSLLVFDDFQKASKEIVDFFRSFKDLETDVKTIVLGRTTPLFYDRRDVVIKKNIREIVLGSLDKESSVKLLRHRKIEKDLDRLYFLTKGHPLLLELVTPETKAEAEEYIKEEIIRKLEEKGRKALEIASVFRHPFPGKAVVDGTSYDTLDELVDKSLMQRSGEIYDLHDVIRDFTYSRLSETKRRGYHKIVAEYYEKEGREGGIIEAMYHFLKAKEQTKAAVLAINNSKNLINNGFWKELSDILERFAQEYVSREKWTKILRWKVECYMLLGKWDDALDYANKALELCKSVDDKNTELSSLCKIAEVYVPRGKHGQALSHLERALEISQKLGDLETTIETQYLMADAYRHTPNLDKALTVLNEAIKLCEKTQNLRWLVKIYAMIGNTYWSMGEYEKSAEFYRKGLGYAEILKDRAEIARLHNNMGVIYSEKEEFDNALPEFEKCIAICSQIGYPRQLGFGLSNAAFAYARKGVDRKAEEYVEKSLAIFKKLKEKGMIGHGLIVYGLIYKNKRLWRKAEENFVGAIKSGEEIGDIYTLSLASFELAKMYQCKGALQKAKQQFENAVRNYEKLGNKAKVKEIKKELAVIEKKD